MTRSRLELLGGFHLISGSSRDVDIAAKKNRALLGILTMAPRQEVTRERLTGLLWSDRGDEQAKNSLRQALVTLRKDFEALDADPLVMNGDRVGLDPNLVSADVIEFLSASASADPSELQHAANLYRGSFLDGLSAGDNAFEDWLRGARADLVSRAIRVLESLAGTLAGDERIAASERLVALDPLREASHRALIEGYIAKGDRSLAIKQYEACKLILKRELGVDPGPELQELRRSLDARDANRDTLLHRDRRPVIAVLPFLNMSEDPGQQYFSDGITEDIITELSRFRSLIVIARHSSFKYHDGDVYRAAKELGAHYLVEGSIRRADERLRITAQLIDASTGNHIWAERYDRNMRDIFAVQDEVAGTIAATLEGRVAASAVAKVKRKPTTDWKAYDYFLQGRDRDAHFDFAGAESFYARAAELDPAYGHAHAFRAIELAIMSGASREPELLRRAEACAQLALSLDVHDAWSHLAVGYVAMLQGNFDLSGVHLERAMGLNLNDVLIAADHAEWLVRTGKPEEALKRLDAAMKRDPFPALWVWEIRFLALFHLKRYDEAVSVLSNMSNLHRWHHIYFAAAYAHAGHLDDARAAVARYLEEMPSASITDVAASEPYSDRKFLEHFLDGLRKAGFPE
jgi:TolB-like protein